MIPFLGVAAGTEWLAILLQALASGAVVIGVTRHFVDPASRGFGRTCLALLLLLSLTSLPFFATMLMPDFMTGIGIIAATVLIAGWRRERLAGRLAWFALIVAAALMHSGDVAILLGVGLAGLASTFVPGAQAARAGAGLVLLGALIGIAGEVIFAQAVTRIAGAPPIRPPFAAACRRPATSSCGARRRRTDYSPRWRRRSSARWRRNGRGSSAPSRPSGRST